MMLRVVPCLISITDQKNPAIILNLFISVELHNRQFLFYDKVGCSVEKPTILFYVRIFVNGTVARYSSPEFFLILNIYIYVYIYIYIYPYIDK
jgi:hypothetical protein